MICRSIALLALTLPLGAQEAVLVAHGRPLGVSFDATAPGAWRELDGAFVGAGVHNLLLARRHPVDGWFRIELRVRIAERDKSAAAVLVGENWLGFEGSSEEVFVNGPQVGVRAIGLAAELIPNRGVLEVSIERKDGELIWTVGGKELLRVPLGDDVPIDRVALVPHRATMYVQECVIRGETALLDPRIAMLPAGFSIPQLDLAADTARQVVVDREAGQYLGHPTTVLLEDGRTMLVVYPKGHGKGAIVYKRSGDGGRTWSDRLPVPASWATSQEVPTIHRTIDPAGQKRLILFSGLRPIRRAHSEDDGATWSELEPIGDFGGIVAMGSVARTASGDYLAWFHDDGRFIRIGPKQAAPVRFTLYQCRSKDGGMTWSGPEVIWTGTRDHLCEPGFVRSPDGGTIALLLRENSRRANSQVIFSRDEGGTWSAPVPLCGALTGDRHTARYAADGRLVVTFRDTGLRSPTQGDWVVWVGRWEDVVAGTEGECRARLMDNQHRWDCAYPGLELLPDGSFVSTTYGHWVEGEAPFIVSVRFRLEELDARVR